MRTKSAIQRPLPGHSCLPLYQSGVSLLELIVFIVVVSIALGALFSVFNHSMVNSVDPIVRVRAMECAQAKLDEIMARKFDENTPSGGVPACGRAETGASGCSGIGADVDFDDLSPKKAFDLLWRLRSS